MPEDQKAKTSPSGPTMEVGTLVADKILLRDQRTGKLVPVSISNGQLVTGDS